MPHPPPQPLAATVLSVCANLTALGTACKGLALTGSLRVWPTSLRVAVSHGPRVTLVVPAVRGRAPWRGTGTRPAQVWLARAVGRGGWPRHFVTAQLTAPPRPQFRAALLGEG